jgi:excisionase family DNA binding protein
MTSGEAARFLGVSARTVTRWADKGQLPYIVTLGGHRRFARSVIEEIRVSRKRDT